MTAEQAETRIIAMGSLGLGGIMVNSHTGGHYLDEPACEPILAAAEEVSSA